MSIILTKSHHLDGQMSRASVSRFVRYRYSDLGVLLLDQVRTWSSNTNDF